MRNLVCLGRTRHLLALKQSTDLPVSAIAPIPASDSSFFIAHGPICENHKIEVWRMDVRSEYVLSDSPLGWRGNGPACFLVASP